MTLSLTLCTFLEIPPAVLRSFSRTITNYQLPTIDLIESLVECKPNSVSSLPKTRTSRELMYLRNEIASKVTRFCAGLTNFNYFL